MFRRKADELDDNKPSKHQMKKEAKAARKAKKRRGPKNGGASTSMDNDDNENNSDSESDADVEDNVEVSSFLKRIYVPLFNKGIRFFNCSLYDLIQVKT